MNKFLKTLLITFTVAGTFSMTCHAANFSSYWYQDGANWKIQDGSGNTISNAWVCDNAVTANHNTDTNWYLMNTNGVMYEGIIQDQSGNYYLLNPNHDGTYGMMVTTNGFTYNGVTYQFDQNHDGTFGMILNVQDIGRSGLSVTQVNTTGKPNYYTNDFMSSYSSGSSGSSASSQTTSTSSQQSSNKNSQELSWDDTRDASEFMATDEDLARSIKAGDAAWEKFRQKINLDDVTFF